MYVCVVLNLDKLVKMLALENADEILQILDRFTKQKSKEIPPELEEYIDFVAKTGDTVYRWPTVQYLFREKLRNVIKEFHDTTASIEGKKNIFLYFFRPFFFSIVYFRFFFFFSFCAFPPNVETSTVVCYVCDTQHLC